MPSVATVTVLTGSFMTRRSRNWRPKSLLIYSTNNRRLYVTAMGAPRGALDASAVTLSFSF
jgi:hypothetical protein